jgi:hypothetical protein
MNAALNSSSATGWHACHCSQLKKGVDAVGAFRHSSSGSSERNELNVHANCLSAQGVANELAHLISNAISSVRLGNKTYLQPLCMCAVLSATSEH